ncbi:Imm41 family immunity protein [Marinomonas sp.]|uniref:Imm41 family immunity protein n=1 Tax=Marinomonas sp. TaxID=1904862 RepID=UPI003BA90C1C
MEGTDISRNVVYQNFPHNSEYEIGSFLGCLHEESVWNEEEYWKLEGAIYQLFNEEVKNTIARDIAWPLFRIYSHAMLLLQSHYDKNDQYFIMNLDEVEVQDYRERIQQVFEGFFQNKMPKIQDFEKRNPLF